MPNITDWLMVIITFVYVVATAAICVANFKSAKATKQQIAESQRQFDETRRLQYMPALQISITRIHLDMSIRDLCLRIAPISGKTGDFWYFSDVEVIVSNVGMGPAKDICYHWFDTRKDHDRGSFPIRSLSSQEKDSFSLTIEIPDSDRAAEELTYLPCLTLFYKDLLGNQYKQVVQLKLHLVDRDTCYNESPLRFDSFSAEPAVLI